MLAQQKVPLTEPEISAEEAHGALIMSSDRLADLCQEELTPSGVVNISRLIAQVNLDLVQTVTAFEREGSFS